MKRILPYFSILLFGLFACSAPEIQKEERKPFKEALENHFGAVVNKNLEPYVGSLAKAETLHMVFPDGEMLTHIDSIAQFHKDWFAQDNWTFEYQIIKQDQVGDLAYAFLDIDYRKQKEGEDPLHLNFYLNVIFKYIDGEWLLVHDQNTLYK